jgi:hypothetical protein
VGKKMETGSLQTPSTSGESTANLVTPLSTGRTRRKPPWLGGRKEKAPRKESPGAELSLIPCHNQGIDTVTVKPKIGIILGTLHHAGQQDL